MMKVHLRLKVYLERVELPHSEAYIEVLLFVVTFRSMTLTSLQKVLEEEGTGSYGSAG